MPLTREQQQALDLARARARKRIAEERADGQPWERFRDQSADLKPWERARLQQEEAALRPSEPDMDEAFLWAAARKRKPEAEHEQASQDDLKPWERAKRQQEVELARARARARARAAQEQTSEGKPWEKYRDQSTKRWRSVDYDPFEDPSQKWKPVDYNPFEPQTEGKPWERYRDQSRSQSREARVQSEFEALPWYGKAGQAVMDVARLGANGATFGFADKLAAGLDAALTDRTYDQSLARARELTDEARIRAGLAGDVAEIGASIMPMNAAASAGLSATRLVPQGLSRTTALGAKLIAGGVEGAGYGALHGAGHDEDIGDAASVGALAGIGGTAAAQVVGGVTQRLAQLLKREKPKVPSTEELAAQPQAAGRVAKSEAVESALREAELAANPERATRTLIGRLAKRDDLTPDEAMAIRDVAKGGLLRNTTRLTGDLLAPQGPLGGASTAGAVSGLFAGYPSAVAAPLVGAGAKMLSDRITKRKANRLAELMRAGGTREALEGPDNALQRLAKTKRDALARALLAGELSLASYAVSQD
jgi:hypothetical protein